MTTWLCHITTQQAWERAQALGQYEHPSLTTEGFIHCSYPEQVVTTAGRFFAGQNGLVLLWIARDRVTEKLQDDSVPGHGTFPHLYGALNLDAVVQVSNLRADEQGIFCLPTAPF